MKYTGTVVSDSQISIFEPLGTTESCFACIPSMLCLASNLVSLTQQREESMECVRLCLAFKLVFLNDWKHRPAWHIGDVIRCV